MAARTPKDEQVEAAVERAETAEQKAEEARARAADLAARRLDADEEALRRAQGIHPAGAATSEAPIPQTEATGLVSVTLAHPLSVANLRAANISSAGDRDLFAGDVIAVRPEVARSLTAAGYVAGVDPGDQDAVRALFSA